MASSWSLKTASTAAVPGQHKGQQSVTTEIITFHGRRCPLPTRQATDPDADVPAYDDVETKLYRVLAGVARNRDAKDLGSRNWGNITRNKTVVASPDFADDDVETNEMDAHDIKESGWSISSHSKVIQGAKLSRLWLYFLSLFLVLVGTSGQENRCICSLRGNTELFTYDHERLNLPLPCTYRLTSIKTRDGRCQITVDLAMTAEEGKKTRPSGIRFLVTQDGYTSGGIIDHRGVTPIDRNLRSGPPLVLPEITSVNGVNILAYQDDTQSYKLTLTECKVTLHYKSGYYLGVYSHDYSSSYLYNPRDLCGDCDGTRNEMAMKLPPDMIGQVRSLKERDAAMLYMASVHISGGPKKCFDYRNLVSNCRKPILLRALQVCGQLFNEKNPLVTCLSGRTDVGQVLDTHYHCVHKFCQGSSRLGCRYIYDLASSMFCNLPMRMGC